MLVWIWLLCVCFVLWNNLCFSLMMVSLSGLFSVCIVCVCRVVSSWCMCGGVLMLVKCVLLV